MVLAENQGVTTVDPAESLVQPLAPQLRPNIRTILEYRGLSLCVLEWSLVTSIAEITLINRMRHSWEPARILTTRTPKISTDQIEERIRQRIVLGTHKGINLSPLEKKEKLNLKKLLKGLK